MNLAIKQQIIELQPALLRVKNLSFEREERTIFADLSCEIKAGEIWQIVGVNGSGKTTLLRLLAGLLQPSAGEIQWNNLPLTKLAADYRAQMLFIGHRDACKLNLTPLENLRLQQALAGKTAWPIPQALMQMGLRNYQHQLCRHLSEGQRRRVALTRLLLDDAAALWLLDEPFTALDQATINQVSQLMIEHATRGGMVILSSHQTLPVPGIQQIVLEQ